LERIDLKVFVTRRLLPPYLEVLNEICIPEIWDDKDPPPRDVLLEKVVGIDGLLYVS
jgi:glyoxylate reductase